MAADAGVAPTKPEMVTRQRPTINETNRRRRRNPAACHLWNIAAPDDRVEDCAIDPMKTLQLRTQPMHPPDEILRRDVRTHRLDDRVANPQGIELLHQWPKRAIDYSIPT